MTPLLICFGILTTWILTLSTIAIVQHGRQIKANRVKMSKYPKAY